MGCFGLVNKGIIQVEEKDWIERISQPSVIVV